MGETGERAPAIYRALANVIADIGTVGKDKVNKQQGFKYRSVDDVYNALHPALAKNKVVIVPEILDMKEEVVGETRNGTRMTLTTCNVQYTLFAEDGSYVISVIPGRGLDTGDKGINKAMAIAYKYLCFQVFCIPTEDMTDPDAESPEIPAGKPKSDGKQKEKKEQSVSGAEEKAPAAPARITDAMLNTIRSEQKRTGVTDKQILGIHDVTAKKVEDLTVEEFKTVMVKFQHTGDLKREEKA